MNLNTLIALLNFNKEQILSFDKYARDYLSWKVLTTEFKKELQLIDEIETCKSCSSEYNTKENYWSINYPIVLEYYPYNGCKVYKNKDCQSYYFVYVEYGGHAPEERCRLIQKELIKIDIV